MSVTKPEPDSNGSELPTHQDLRPKANDPRPMTQDQGPETEDLSQTAAAHLKMLDLNSNLVSPKALHSLTHMFKHPLYCDFTSV